MGTVTHFGVKNLRSLHDTGSIELRPLMILVGSNGSGKSSFLRCFPLLKQSVTHESTSPLLWFGDLVDFGSISETRTRGSDESVVFQFTVNVDRKDMRRRYFRNQNPNAFFTLDASISVDIELELHPSKTGDRTVVQGVSVSMLGRRVSFKSQKNDTSSPRYATRVFVDDRLFETQAIAEIESGRGIVPHVRYQDLRTDDPGMMGVDHILAQIARIASPLFHGSVSQNNRLQLLQGVRIGNDGEMKASMASLEGGAKWRQRVESMAIDGEQFSKIRDGYFVRAASHLLDIANSIVVALAKGVRYSGPVRATADRYYRRQELAVDEVDYRGANLAMWMSSLSPDRRRKFSTWCERNLGFEPRIAGSSGHLSLEIGIRGSYYNIADMGFGFSQLLPVVAQSWESMSRPRTLLNSFDYGRSESMCVIEQPELHLHPEFQARMADTFVGVLKAGEESNPTRILIETHSESIINRIGEHIERGTLKSQDVGVFVFEPKPGGGTNVRMASFHPDGTMMNWPYGFFSSSKVPLPGGTE